MKNPTIKIHDIETGEVIERDFNEAELAQLAIDEEKALEKEQAEMAKIVEKTAVLAKLGLTADEVKLLLS